VDINVEQPKGMGDPDEIPTTVDGNGVIKADLGRIFEDE